MSSIFKSLESWYSRRFEVKIKFDVGSELFLKILNSDLIDERGEVLQCLSGSRDVSMLRAV